MKNLIIALFLLGGILMPGDVSAQYITAPGQPQAVSVLPVLKYVQNPDTKEFKQRIDSNEFSFLPGNEIVFRIEIRNVQQTDLNNISVRDVLPAELEFISGPGLYDPGSRTLSFVVDKLRPGEVRVVEFKARIRDAEFLPAPDMVTCTTNYVEARMNQLFGQANAAFCIGNQVLGLLFELPRTGGKDIWLVGGLLSLGLGSYFFWKSKAIFK